LKENCEHWLLKGFRFDIRVNILRLGQLFKIYFTADLTTTLINDFYEFLCCKITLSCLWCKHLRFIYWILLKMKPALLENS